MYRIQFLLKVFSVPLFIITGAFFSHSVDAGTTTSAFDTAYRNRVIVCTDISNEPDDQQSLVRFLTYANEFDIEGIIATTSCWKKNDPDTATILEVIDAYETVLPNLLLHSPGYPSAEYLRSITRFGVDGYAMKAAEQ